MAIIKKTGFELHPAGTFEGRLISLEEAENSHPEEGPQFRCIFETAYTSQLGGNLRIPYYISQKLNQRSKLAALVKALGIDLNQLPYGVDFDTDELLGRTCNLVMEHQQRDDGSVSAEIISILAVERKPTDGLIPLF